MARHPPGKRNDPEEGQPHEPQAEREVPNGGPSRLAKPLAHRAGHAHGEAGRGVGLKHHHPVRAVRVRGDLGRAGDDPEALEPLHVRGVGSEDLPARVECERDGPLPPVRRGEDGEQELAHLRLLRGEECFLPRLLEHPARRLRPALAHPPQPVRGLLQDRLGAVAHLLGHLLHFLVHGHAEGALRGDVGPDRDPQQGDDGQQQEGERELGAEPHRHSPSTWTTTSRRCGPLRCSQR